MQRQAQQIAAQLWLTRNIGVKPAEDVDGEVVVGVAVKTRDSGNLGTDPAEGAGVSTASPGQITVDIESRADAVAIAAEAEGVLSAPIQSAEVSSSADGIELLSTDSDGLFSGISAAGGGAVDNSQFDGLIIGVTLDAGASSQTAVLADLSQIALEVRAADPEAPDQIVVVNEFTPKLNDAGDAYLFNVPTLGASHSLHIVTPSYFDGSIELSVQTLSQGSAGDTAISEAVTQTLTVLSQGDGVDLKVGSATGVEDSPVPVRLPISVTRKDVSEEIADVTLSLVTAEFGDAVDAISYVSRVETRMTDIAVTVDAGLVASDATFTDAAALRVDPATGEVDASSAKQVAFADLSDVSLVVRAAPGYGQKVPDLKGKTLAQIEDGFSGEVYGYFLRGTYELEDGTAVEAVFGARFEDGAFVDDTDVGLFAFQQSVGNSFADLATTAGVDPFVTASPNEDALKTDFVIDIAAAAEALAGSGATQAQKIEAQLWLTRNIGVKPAEDVDGEVVVGVAVKTRDSGNLGTEPADGAGVSTASPGQITVDIESRADAVAIAAEAEGVLSAPIQSAEVSSSADGIELLSTDSDGLFSGISAAGGGAVDNSQFDGLIIGVTLDAGASSQTAVLADLSQIALEVRAADPEAPDQIVVVNEFTPKLNDAGDAYLFNVPTLGASHSLHIVTPSYFDGSIELSVQTLSQGSAGDTAISEAVTQTLTVLSQGDGVDLKVGSATGVEDSPVPVRLPISVTRKDVSEEIADVTLSLVTAEFGDAVDAISYVSRVETRMTDIAVTVDAGLVASDATFTDAAALRVDPATGEVDASSAKQVAFADLSDVSLVVRAAPGYGQKVPDLKGKTLAQIEAGFSGEVYGYFLRGTYELEDGTAVEAVFGARFEDGAFVDDTDVGLFAFQQSVGNSFADLAPDGVDPFVTASQNSDDELKTDFVIDIAAAAEALAGEDATSAEQIAAQLWLTRNIGVKPAEDVDGEVVVGVAVRTRDSGNLGTDPAEGAGVSTASTGQITVDIESRADAVAIAAEAEGVLSAPIQSAEVSSSADGIELLSTDGDGLFSGISAAGGGAVDNSQFDGLIIGVSLDAGASSQTAVLADLSQIALEVRDDPEAPDQCCYQRVYAEVERCR